MRWSRLLILGLLAAATAVAGCTFDKIALPYGSSQVVVHGVLNPGVLEQVVLVERTLSGNIVAPRAAFDSLDPIVSDGGTPERNASVVIIGPAGDSVILREDAVTRGDGRGAGVYRFQNTSAEPDPGNPVPRFVVTPGAQYRLRVRTAGGATVTGSTVVPLAPGVIASPVRRDFPRDRDSIFLGWPGIARSARYEIRVESPSGPFIAFVDDLEYLVSGMLVLPNATGRPRVFWPGFRQVITVSAVDANYHDYYRSGSDPVSSRGLLSRVEGGIGVFGSLSRVRESVADVIGSDSAPPAGRWAAESGVGGVLPASFRLWTESSAFGAARLTGLVLGQPISGPRQAIVAEQFGARFTVAVLREQSLRDTLVTLDGTIESNAGVTRFTGSIRGSAGPLPVVYRITP